MYLKCYSFRHTTRLLMKIFRVQFWFWKWMSYIFASKTNKVIIWTTVRKSYWIWSRRGSAEVLKKLFKFNEVWLIYWWKYPSCKVAFEEDEDYDIRHLLTKSENRKTKSYSKSVQMLEFFIHLIICCLFGTLTVRMSPLCSSITDILFDNLAIRISWRHGLRNLRW